MSFKDRYKTNKEAEENGQWVDFGDGIRVKVRRLNSKVSRDVRAKLEKPYQGQFRNREMPQELQEELVNKQLGMALVVDWEGVDDPDDTEGKNPPGSFPCTADNVIKVMAAFPDFREDVLTACMSMATFQEEVMKASEKNSKNASAGS